MSAQRIKTDIEGRKQNYGVGEWEHAIDKPDDYVNELFYSYYSYYAHRFNREQLEASLTQT